MRRGATIQEQDGLSLWLSTDLRGVLVRQFWGEGLSAPELVPTPAGVEVIDLRVHGDVVCIQEKTAGWLQRVSGKWEPVKPDWAFSEGAPSKWRFSGESRQLSYAGELTEWVDTGNSGALAADVLTRELESDGSALGASRCWGRRVPVNSWWVVSRTPRPNGGCSLERAASGG